MLLNQPQTLVFSFSLLEQVRFPDFEQVGSNAKNLTTHVHVGGNWTCIQTYIVRHFRVGLIFHWHIYSSFHKFRWTVTPCTPRVQSQVQSLFELSQALDFRYSRTRCTILWVMVRSISSKPVFFLTIRDFFIGWGNSILALICLVIGCPAPFIFYRYGPRLRAWSKSASVE